MATIFSRIIAGEIPCYKVAEDDRFFAFLDINPLTKGHTLVVPKQEIDSIFGLNDEDTAAMYVFAKKIACAIEQTIPCKRVGMAVIGLEVPHAHIHLIPIHKESDMLFSNPKLKLKEEEFKDIANTIRKALSVKADEQFEKLGLALPPAPKPMGLYKPCLVIDGKYLYLSGHVPVLEDGSQIKGRVGSDMTADEGKLAARQAGLTLLASVKAQLGSLNRIRRVIKVLGMVSCTPEFEAHPYVINGCSELFASVWGNDNGVGTRSAVGVNSLPGNIPVEIEALFEIAED